MLLNKCEEMSNQNSCSVGPPSKRPATEDTKSKLWGCLSQILSETDSVASKDYSSNSGEVDRFLAEPLLDFKTGNPYKWWEENYKYYPLLSKVARRYLSSLQSVCHPKGCFVE